MSEISSTSDKTDRNNRRLRVAFALAVLVGAVILIVVTEFASIPDPESHDEAKPRQSESGPPATSRNAPARTNEIAAVEGPRFPGPTAIRAFVTTPFPPPAPVASERSTLADTLNHPSRTIQQDLDVLTEVFTNYVEEFRELPVGNNAEITAALAGDNARGYAPITADHRAINKTGELVDRWGTPFFFHQLSAHVMEIRSSGPDTRRFTEDDIVWPQLPDEVTAESEGTLAIRE